MANKRSGRTCERGHSLDPHWKDCPYCAAEDRNKKVEPVHVTPPPAPQMGATGDRGTRVGSGAHAAFETRGATRVLPSQPAASFIGGASGDRRKVVGIAITYSHAPEGQLYPILEGKTFIGADRIGSEPGERPCDIRIPDDPRMSSEHALILVRHGIYEIVDRNSSNGTFLNGEMIQAARFENYAEVITGSTVWTLIQIQPPKTAAPVAKDSPSREPAPDPQGPPARPRDSTRVL